VRSSFARALTGTALTAGLLATSAGAAVANDTHTVRSGDTLASIAEEYDGVSSWRDLAEANTDIISDPNLIFVGQQLALGGATPAPTDPDTHTVEPGDTLAGVAALYESVSSWQALAEANADIVSDPNVIRVGQELALSGTASSSTSSAPEPESTPEPESAPEPEATPEPEAESEPASEAPASNGNVSVATWDRVAECESNGDWSINTGNGYYGGLQFALSSWEWVGGSGMPHEASKSEQIARAEILLERQGWGAWPACSSALGLR
jgi:LysM repeat protein